MNTVAKVVGGILVTAVLFVVATTNSFLAGGAFALAAQERENEEKKEEEEETETEEEAE